MEIVKDLLKRREDEYLNAQNRVQGIREVLKNLKEYIDKRFGLGWKIYIEKYIDKKEKDCKLILEICEENIKRAEGPMTDKDKDCEKVA